MSSCMGGAWQAGLPWIGVGVGAIRGGAGQGRGQGQLVGRLAPSLVKRTICISAFYYLGPSKKEMG